MKHKIDISSAIYVALMIVVFTLATISLKTSGDLQKREKRSYIYRYK